MGKIGGIEINKEDKFTTRLKLARIISCRNAYWNYLALIPNAFPGFVRGTLLDQLGNTHMILPWWKRISVLKTYNKLDLRHHHEICFHRDTGKENNFVSSS